MATVQLFDATPLNLAYLIDSVGGLDSVFISNSGGPSPDFQTDLKPGPLKDLLSMTWATPEDFVNYALMQGYGIAPITKQKDPLPIAPGVIPEWMILTSLNGSGRPEVLLWPPSVPSSFAVRFSMFHSLIDTAA